MLDLTSDEIIQQKINKFCGQNDMVYGSAHDRWIARDFIEAENKLVMCDECEKKFNYLIEGFIKYSYKICNKCCFLKSMNDWQ